MVQVEAQRKSSRVNNVVILRDVCHLLLLIVTCKDMAVLGGWMQIANSKCKEWVRGDKLHEIGGAEKTVVLFAHCYQYIISSSSILKKKKKSRGIQQTWAICCNILLRQPNQAPTGTRPSWGDLTDFSF